MKKEDLSFEQYLILQDQQYRQALSVAYLLFLIAWFLFVAWVFYDFEINEIEAMGIGTATGIFIAKFSDMWQFVWRRAPDFYSQKKGDIQ